LLGIEHTFETAALLFTKVAGSLTTILDERHQIALLDLSGGQTGAHFGEFRLRHASTLYGLGPKVVQAADLIVRQGKPFSHRHDRFDARKPHGLFPDRLVVGSGVLSVGRHNGKGRGGDQRIQNRSI